MSERKRPLWPLLTAALIGLPVLYVASFGPAMWIAQNSTASMRGGIAAVYWPVGSVAVRTQFVPFAWYVSLWGTNQGGYGTINHWVDTFDVPVGANGEWGILYLEHHR